MHTKDCMTAIGGLEEFGFENGAYPLRIQQFDSISEAVARIGKCSEDDVAIEAPEGALAAGLAVMNAAQEQGGKQGGKEVIRKAMAEGKQEEVDTEVAAHQTRAGKYVIGAPRGSAVGGVTKTRAGNVGKALLEKMGPEALLALAAEHGLDPDELS